MKNKCIKLAAIAAAVSGCALLSTPAMAQDKVDQIVKVGQEASKEGVKSQTKVDAISDKTDNINAEYKQVNTRIDGLVLYNTQMKQSIRRQEKQLSELEESISQVNVMQRQMQPLATRMLVALKNFVELDMPFRVEEREERLARLEENLSNPNLSTAEKFRQILEGYKIENDYGRGIAHYTQTIDYGTGPVDMNVLQIGRVALVAQTAGQETSIAWDNHARKWVELDKDQYKAAIIKGLRISKKQAPLDLMVVPAMAPEAAQ